MCRNISTFLIKSTCVCAGRARSPRAGRPAGGVGSPSPPRRAGQDTRAPGRDTRAPASPSVGTHGSRPRPVGNFQSPERLNDLSGHFVTRNRTSREKPPKPRNLLQHCTHPLNIFMTSYVIMLKVITPIELLRVYNCSIIFA